MAEQLFLVLDALIFKVKGRGDTVDRPPSAFMMFLVYACYPFCRGSLNSCGEKSSRYMLPQAQECAFIMEPCRPCGEKHLCHTETASEKQAEAKTEPHSQTILWQPQNRKHHIKRKN
jgi:hypothetical protein